MFCPRTKKRRRTRTKPRSPMASPAALPTPNRRGKRKGHGRNGALDYPGAERVAVPHESFKAGDPCPVCPGRLYDTRSQPCVPACRPADLLGDLYELMKLRCSLCGRFSRRRHRRRLAPPSTAKKFRRCWGFCATATDAFDANREPATGLGRPLPAGTQWGLLWKAAPLLMPVFNTLIQMAAQAWLFYHDDTHMKVPASCRKPSPERRGLQRTDGHLHYRDPGGGGRASHRLIFHRTQARRGEFGARFGAAATRLAGPHSDE